MRKRKAITEIISVKTNGETPAYIPFANGEKIQSIEAREKGIVATFRAVESDKEVGGITTSRKNETVFMGNLKTVCLIIETKQACVFEIVTIK